MVTPDDDGVPALAALCEAHLKTWIGPPGCMPTEKELRAAQDKRNSALCRMAGNIAGSVAANFPAFSPHDEMLEYVADVSTKLARIIYRKVHEL
jgi:hypothetical protein